jgi:general secretion pathway protein B
MSFILDALKKSESDHQRQGGPALFEVKVAPPRGMLPPWAIALAVLLAANLGVVLWLLLRHGAAAADAPPVASATPHTVPGSATTAPAAAPPAAPSAGPSPIPAPATVAARGGAAAEPALTASERAAPPPAALEPAANPDDYAPAAEPPAGAGHVLHGTDSGVPLYQQIAAAPDKQLPQLRLDLHAYADKADDRWVMVNMHKLKEGDSLPEGVRVEHITPDGAVLSWHGQQFLLTRE